MDEDSAMDGGEATMPDTAIMEQNIDDLFGEAADSLAVDALGVAMPDAPLPPALALHMAEKQSRGCCTKLAWSNTGSIAQIVDNGTKIDFRTMLRDPKTAQWTLTEPSKTPITAPEGAFFEHLQFSGIGIDLATADNHGIVRVYALAGALGKMPLAPSNIVQDSSGLSDLDVVVGLHWLPMYPAEFRAPYVTPATEIGGKWVTEMRSRSSSEQTVHNPADNRHALCYVSRNAKFTLMYQNELVWHATSMDLETPDSSCELLSHASITENADHLLAITHDVGRKFRLYKLTIAWNTIQNTRPGGPPYITVTPTLQIERLTMLDHVAAQQADLALLSDLRLVSPTPAGIADPDAISIPVIVALFTRATLPREPTQHQDCFSIIARWHVECAAPELHESFVKMKPNGNNSPQNPITLLTRQEDIITSKLLLGMEPQYHNTILAFTASDASTEFRDRVTMAGIEPYGDTTTVSSLAQAGFEHMMGDHNTDIAMSPDGSTLVLQRSDDTLTYKLMTLRYSWHPLEDGISDTSGLVEAAVVCLARQYAILCCSQTANDDILALLPQNFSADLRTLFVREVIKMTTRALDIVLTDFKQQQVYAVKEGALRLAISASYVINKKPGTQQPTWAGKYAFAYLSARNACTALAQILTRFDAFVQPYFVHALRGVVKWCCDFIVYIADSLITLKRATKSTSTGQSTSSASDAFIAAAISAENPVLNLLLSAFTRIFLRFILLALPRYFTAIQKSLPNARSVSERTDLEDTYSYYTNLPFKLHTFDALITDIDTSIRNRYTSASKPVSSERRVEIELHTITTATPASEHDSVIQNLLDTALPKFMENLDVAGVYFRDTTWLGIEFVGEEARRKYDVVRKLPIAKGAKLRLCRRCGSVMEDGMQERLREMAALAHAQRACVCGNYWIMA